MGIKRTIAKYYFFQETLFKQFMASAKLNTLATESNSTLINLGNGTFEITLEYRRLRDYRREDALTYQLPFEYDKEATAPLFMRYLDRVLPRKDLQDVLAEFMGYIFVRNSKLAKCLLLFGNGANGKSVFFDIIHGLLGEQNISSLSLGNLGEDHNRVLISDKLLNYGSEIKAVINSDLFKQLVSGEPVQCRMKYGHPFMIKNYAKLAFNCNELPKDVEHTEAYFRRFLIVPFEVTIPEGEQNPDLADSIISSELPGVFNWILSGLDRLLINKGFTESDVVDNIVSSYKQESDNVFQFLQENNFQKSSTTYLLTKWVYQEYKEFCLNDGYRALSNIRFNKRLSNLGYPIERHNNGMVVFMQRTK